MALRIDLYFAFKLRSWIAASGCTCLGLQRLYQSLVCEGILLMPNSHWPWGCGCMATTTTRTCAPLKLDVASPPFLFFRGGAEVAFALARTVEVDFPFHVSFLKGIFLPTQLINNQLKLYYTLHT